MRLPIKDNTGFTLIEVIMTLLIIAIMGVVTMSFVTRLIETNQDSTTQLKLVDEVNLALETMTRELRRADEATWPVKCGAPAGACVPGVAYTSITFSKDIEVPQDSARVDTNFDDIVYALTGSNLQRTSAGVTTTLATNVSGFSITEAPLPGALPPALSGLFEITLTLTEPSTDLNYSFTSTTAVQIRNRMPSLNIAFVVQTPNIANLHSTREAPWHTHFTNTLGHTVQLQDDDVQTWAPTNFDVVVLSCHGGPNDDTWLKPAAVPILTLDGRNFNEFDLGISGNRTGGSASADIIVNSHFITKIFLTGVRALDNGGLRGLMGGFATKPESRVAQLVSYNGTLAKLLIAEAGRELATGPVGNLAPARRAFYGACDFIPDTSTVNRDGLSLFNRTLAWVSGNGS